MSPATCLAIMNKNFISLDRIDYLLLDQIFEGLDNMHPYQKIMSEYYYPLHQSSDSCIFPCILGFGVGFIGYKDMLERNSDIQYHQVCKELAELEMDFDAPLFFIQKAKGVKYSLTQVFSTIQETIIEYDQSDYIRKESKSCCVFDFSFQASLKILHFQVTKTYDVEESIDFQTLSKSFEKIKNSENDEATCLKIQSWIQKLQTCLLILENVGSFAAALYSSTIFFDLDKEFTLQPLSQSEMENIEDTLQIKQTQVLPSDISPKTIAFLEFLDSFLQSNSQERPLTLIIVENSDLAMFLFNLLIELSSVFENISVAFAGNYLNEMKDLKTRKVNSIILTDLEDEKDFSVLLEHSIEGVIFFDSSSFSFEFFSELESIPQLAKIFEMTKRIAMMKRNDRDAMQQISRYRLKIELSRFLKGKEILAENNEIDFITLLMGELSGRKLKSKTKKNACISAERSLQTLSWFCSQNRLAPPYLVQFWPPDSMSQLNDHQIDQEWKNLISLLADQLKNRSIGNEEEMKLLRSSDTSQLRSIEFFAFACCWKIQDKECIIYGFPRITEKLAQNNASLLACEDMYLNEKMLDEKMKPVRISPAKTDTASINNKQIRPSAFDPLEPSEMSTFDLYVTVFVIRPTEEENSAEAQVYPPPFFTHQYVAIATKRPIPIDSIPCFDIFPRKTDRYIVDPHHFHPLGESIEVNSGQMEIMEGFQDKVWGEYVGLKKKNDTDETRWFLILPVLHCPPLDESLSQTWKIDWEFLKMCLDHRIPCTAYQFLSHIATTESPIESPAIEINKSKSNTSDLEKSLNQINEDDQQGLVDYLNQALSDVVVGVLHDPSARYINLRIDPKFHGNDVFVMDDDCISFASHFQSRGIHVSHLDIFGLQGQKLHRYSNVLSEVDVKSIQEDYTSLLLDVAHVLPISEWFLQQVWTIPSIVHYLEPFCIADDFLNQYGIAIDLIPVSQLYPAFVHSSTNRVENYERLEFLGDAALKLVIAIYLYQNEQDSEGEFSRKKDNLVSNTNLNHIGRLNHFDGMIQVADFNPWFFKPPRYESRSAKASPSRIVSSKMCADVVEAIAGSFFLTGGLLSVWKYFEAIGMVPGIEHIWIDIDKQVLFAPIPDQINFERVKQIEECIGYEFTTPSLLSMAMTHSSISMCFNYERLEFLGDALLDLLLAKYTYDIYPGATPQALSNMRVNAVNNEAFSRMSFELGLHHYLQQSGYDNVIKEYTTYLETLEPYSDPYKTEIEGPKILGDIFESLVGAIFIDCQGNLDRVWQVVFQKWKPYLDKYISPELVFVSDLRRLYEFLATDGREVTFKFSSDLWNNDDQAETCELYVGDKLFATARAQSKKLAKEAAAKVALEILAKELEA